MDFFHQNVFFNPYLRETLKEQKTNTIHLFAAGCLQRIWICDCVFQVSSHVAHSNLKVILGYASGPKNLVISDRILISGCQDWGIASSNFSGFTFREALRKKNQFFMNFICRGMAPPTLTPTDSLRHLFQIFFKFLIMYSASYLVLLKMEEALVLSIVVT